MTGRAISPEQKRAVVERLLAAWLRAPDQRLGQLIDNAVELAEPPVGRQFIVEDEELADLVEAFVASVGR